LRLAEISKYKTHATFFNNQLTEGNMFQEVTRYQTRDGQLHESEDDARQHIVTALENAVGPIIDRSKIGFSARLAVARELVGSPEAALALKRLLEKFV
jgi:hypothetical protein